MKTGPLLPAFVVAALVLAVAIPKQSGAQQWRTMESSRQVHDSAPVSVHVTYGAGDLTIAPSNDRSLYHMQLRYDADRSTPRSEFDAGTHALRVGLGKSVSGINIGSNKSGAMDLSLARGVPLSVELDLGAVEGKIDLGGLSLQRLELRSGASDVDAKFGSPNMETLAQLSVQSGAASVSLSQLGNANVRNIDANVGAGSLTLDFGGNSPMTQTDVNVSVAVGGLTVRVPRAVAIEVELSRTLSTFNHDGLEQRGKMFVTTDTDSATRRVRIHGSSALGSIDIIRY